MMIVRFWNQILKKKEAKSNSPNKQTKLIGNMTEAEIQKGQTVLLLNSNVIDSDMIKALQYCFNEGYMYYPLNNTILTLVVENTVKMADFRPIACCHLVYKYYSRILTNRLKKTLHTFIPRRQNAFIKGRQISENGLLLMHELVRGYHKAGGKPRAVIKIDIWYSKLGFFLKCTQVLWNSW